MTNYFFASLCKNGILGGGILENEIEVDGTIEQRYWIHLA